MKVKEIMKLSKKQVDDELFRQIDNSWGRKDLIYFVVNNLSYTEKRKWIKDWYRDMRRC